MNILKSKDTSRYGNDCYINETISLVEQFGIYAIVFCQKISGWAPKEDIFVAQTTTDLAIAEKMFEDYTSV